jgi:uncharacterized membrane protein (DUF4010 family)
MDPAAEMTTVIRLTVAALCGLAVGVEREWSGHVPTPHARFAGVRTMFLIGGVGGVAGVLSDVGYVALSIGLVAGALGIVVGAYVNASRAGGDALDATTEVAALVVLALGMLAGLGELAIAGGAAAIVVMVLGEKARLHGAIARVGAGELRAAFTFAVLALVILPVLPSARFGPLGGINPRELWIVVLVFSGLNFGGYVARRAVGRTRGDTVAGALGGVISSTAVTWQFSRRSRDDDAAAAGLAAGAVAACTVLLPRLVLLSAVLNVGVAWALVPLLIAPFVTGVVLVGWSVLRDLRPEARGQRPEAGGTTSNEPNGSESPLRFWSAMRMAVAFQAALMGIEFVRTRLGEQGVLASAAVLGLTDMDALTLSMNRLGEAPGAVGLAAKAIAVGVVANTVLKLSLAVVFGSASFRLRAGAGLAALLTVSLAALLVLW